MPARGSVLWRAVLLLRPAGPRLFAATLIAALAAGCSVALMATSAWLIARAAQHPPILTLMVAIVAVRAFGIGRGVFRYGERLSSHDSAFPALGAVRVRLPQVGAARADWNDLAAAGRSHRALGVRCRRHG